MRTTLISIFLAFVLVGAGIANAAGVFQPVQGGTGISSATAGDVGNCLKVLTNSPFAYTLGTCGSGSSFGQAWEIGGNGFTGFLAPTTTQKVWVGQASSTLFSVNGPAYFGATATSSFDTAGNLSAIGWIRGANGSASSPTYSFTSSNNTGTFYDVSGGLGLTYAGTESFRINSSIVGLGGSGSNLIVGSPGSAATPVYSFTNRSNTGIFSPATNQIAISVGAATSTLFQTSGASTTSFSVVSKLYVGGTATTTIDNTGNVVIPSGSTLTNTGTSDGCATWTGAVLGSAGSPCASGNDPFSHLTNFGTTFSATSSPLWTSKTTGVSFAASSTAWFDQVNVGSTTSGLMATSTFYGNLKIVGNLEDDTITNSLVFDSTGGTLIAYGGTSCTNQFIRSLNGAGVATCASVNLTSGTDVTGTLPVANGGTGQTSFLQGWLNSDGTTISASTSPTVNYITATSTTASSTFQSVNVLGTLGAGAAGFQIGTTGIITKLGGSPVALSGTNFQFNNSAGADLTWQNNSNSANSALVFKNGGAACLTCNIRFQPAANEVARFLGRDMFLIGTTTGLLGNFTIGTSTVPQVFLSDNLGSNLWSLRNINSNLYLATSTATATSSAAALYIDTNSQIYFPAIPASSGNNCLQISTAGQITNTGSACGAGGGLSSYDAWTHPSTGQSATTSLMLFNGQASSTKFSAYTAWFGGQASSTFTDSGTLFAGTTTPVSDATLYVVSTSSQPKTVKIFNIASTTGSSLFNINGNGDITTQLSNALVLSAGAGNTLGAYAGSSCTNQFVRSLNGAGVATCASVSLTADVTGVLPYANGGTGTTTAPVSQLLYGGATAYQSVATTSLGVTAPITFSGTLGAQVGGVGGNFGCTSASAGVTGCLTGTDWTTFNNKQAPGFQISTTSSIGISKVAYFSGVTPTQLSGVATTSVSAGTGLTGTLTTLGSADSFGCSTASASVFGCLTAANWATFNAKVATSAAETKGQLAAWGTTSGTPAQLYSVATTSVSCSGNILCTGFNALGAASTISFTGTLAIANGGTNATTFGTTNGIVAFDGTSLVNFANFTLTAAKMVLSHASSTNFSISQALFAPNTSATSSPAGAGALFINTSSASSSVRFNDGTNIHSIFDTGFGALSYASSTLAYDGAYSASGTTTLRLLRAPRALTLMEFYCDIDTGTSAYVEFGNGSATTTGKCTTGGTLTTPSSNNKWPRGQIIYIGIGTQTGTPNIITATPTLRSEAD